MMSKHGEGEEHLQLHRMWLAMWGGANSSLSTADELSSEDLRRLRRLLPDLSDELIRRLLAQGAGDVDEASPSNGGSSTEDSEEEWSSRIPRSRSSSDHSGHQLPPRYSGELECWAWLMGGAEPRPPWARGYGAHQLFSTTLWEACPWSG